MHRYLVRGAALTVCLLVASAGPAAADVPVGLARYVPCPGSTGESHRYRSPERIPYRCHSAVVDPLGNVVILRQGRSDAGPSAFGWLHALLDHNIDDHVVERSSAAPTRFEHREAASATSPSSASRVTE